MFNIQILNLWHKTDIVDTKHQTYLTWKHESRSNTAFKMEIAPKLKLKKNKTALIIMLHQADTPDIIVTMCFPSMIKVVTNLKYNGTRIQMIGNKFITYLELTRGNEQHKHHLMFKIDREVSSLKVSICVNRIKHHFNVWNYSCGTIIIITIQHHPELRFLIDWGEAQ